jgi:hypothetical protein
MINEKIILWKINFSKENAYKDQYGVPHKAIVVEEEIVATIIEDKTLPIGGSKFFKTFATKAKTEDGRFFLLGYDFNSIWRETDSEFKDTKADFKNAISELNDIEYTKSRLSEDSYMIPVIRENGDLAIPQNSEKCTCPHSEKHICLKLHWYYKPNGHCDCRLKE